MIKIVGFLQFLALMIPTILMLAAAAVSLADLALPADPVAMHLVVAGPEAWENEP